MIYENWGKYDGIHVGELGPLRFANNAAFLALLSAKNLEDDPTEKQNRIKWAQSQVWYTIGDNPSKFSYLIGYGNNYPRKPLHSGSICPEWSEACGCPWFYNPENNPIELFGAVVAGPDFHDS